MSNNESKEAILVDSFNILKDDIERHDSKLATIVEKMITINAGLALEMWKFLLENGQQVLKESGYTLTGGIIYDFKNRIGAEGVIQVFKDHDDLVEACFGISNDVYTYSISEAIQYGEISLADRMLTLAQINPYKDNSFAEILEEVCDTFASDFEDIQTFDEDWDDQDEHDRKVILASSGSNLLLRWVQTVTNSEQRARLNVTLIDYV
ncbi:hypothetical protein ABXV15_14495 [Exiguobacterium profundum]|uniref:hypothetical protein n=1 Tax=Exiguobacterium profundum TaxID=307643 RepID=UPI0033948FF8